MKEYWIEYSKDDPDITRIEQYRIDIELIFELTEEKLWTIRLIYFKSFHQNYYIYYVCSFLP